MAFDGPFPQQAEQAIASYDYLDISDGSSVAVFYGAHKRIDTTDSYFLTRTALASDDIAKDSGTSSNATATKVLDLDFDLYLNVPKIINGRCYFSVPMALNNQSTEGKAYIIAKIRRWDGTTETEIANAQSRTMVRRSAQVTAAQTLLWSVDVANEEFAPTETLRITLEVYQTEANGAGWHHICIGHDPQNRTTWTETSSNAYTIFDGTSTHGIYSTTPQLKFYIPFRNEL